MPKIFFFFGKPAQKRPFSKAYDYLSHDEVLKMFDFLKKRRETEQQRKIKRVLDAQEAFLALYETSTPITLQEELNAVAKSFEQGRRDDRE
jgi:hypothetical protein